MRLDSLTPDHVRRAVGIYLELAWPEPEAGGGGTAARRIQEKMAGASTLGDLRQHFETPRSSDNVKSARYTLRLGNYRYPFMKFVLQEYLLQGEFFFSVDTHDELQITPDMPDYEEWQRVRELNVELKESIEGAWTAAGLPTNDSLRLLMEGEAQKRRDRSEGPTGGQASLGRLLLVDNEDDVVKGLGAVLGSMGYEIELAFDGEQALAALASGPLPDLVVLDFSMPGMSGEEVIERLRKDERTARLPVLLATATSIDPVGMGGANALLRKPYQQDVLFRIIADQLGIEASEGEG